MSAPRRTVTIPSRSGAVRVTYRPMDICMSDYDDAEADPLGTAIRLIVSCTVCWNIGGWNDGRWPITTAAVGHLPEDLFLGIANAIIVDYRVLVREASQEMTA